ncbi:hypothetical protein Misp01_53700 [Microtetraspora sp. NBRC 13810]|nr:hypothetical protein Misp01_53700 [Microtetraspora sp. NBRC 13810]
MEKTSTSYAGSAATAVAAADVAGAKSAAARAKAAERRPRRRLFAVGGVRMLSLSRVGRRYGSAVPATGVT